MNSHRFFVAGIDTNVGKTVVSAILAKAFNAIYLKPVQAGDLDASDSKNVASWIGRENVLPEIYRLKSAMSPHAAAKLDDVEIKLEEIQIPRTSRSLIIEGAGGLMVPLNEEETYLDWLRTHDIPVILVSKNYLGSINHTLLSLEILKQNNIEVSGIIFVGDKVQTTEAIIGKLGACPIIERIPYTDQVNETFIELQAKRIKKSLWFSNLSKL